MKFLIKGFSAVLFICFLIFSVYTGDTNSRKTVKAFYSGNAEYLRVITDDTPFYTEKSADKPIFFLPYTYYVKVIEYGDNFCHVCYADGGAEIDGYVPTYKLFYDGLTVLSPYPAVFPTTAKTTVLYSDAQLTSALQYIFPERELFFYGKYYSPQGNTLYYVAYNNKLGYVKEEELLPFTLSNHPNELTFLIKEESPEEEKPTESEETPENLVNLRILIIAVLGFAGLVALFFAVGKKPKPQPAASYYDENDYE